MSDDRSYVGFDPWSGYLAVTRPDNDRGTMTDPTPDLATPLTARDVIDRQALMAAIEGIAPSWTATIGAKFARNRIVDVIEAMPAATLDAARQPVAETALREAIEAVEDALKDEPRPDVHREWAMIRTALATREPDPPGEDWLDLPPSKDYPPEATREPDPAPLDQERLATQQAFARHIEPHECPREGPWSACDFNRFGPR